MDADVAVGDEEDSKGGIEDPLEDRVDRDKDSAVFVIPAGEASPDQNLFIIVFRMAGSRSDGCSLLDT